MDNIVYGRCSVSQIRQFRIFPALNDEKYNWNKSAGQGLTILLVTIINLHTLEVVVRVSETQLQVGENSLTHRINLPFLNQKLNKNLPKNQFLRCATT